MADITKLSDLTQQLAYLQETGGRDPNRPNLGVEFGQTLGNAATQIQQVIANTLAIKKAQIEQSPIGKSFGVLPQKEEELMASRNLTRVPQNVYPQPTAEQENAPVSGQILPTLEKPDMTREAFKSQYKISPDVPWMVVPEAIKLQMLNQGYAFVNPKDPTDISVTPDPQHTLMVKTDTAARTGTQGVLARESTPVMTEAAGLEKGEVKKGTILVKPKTDENIPTYLKSELLKMSPEERSGLGKYKVVDDTVPSRNEDDNQTIDGIIKGLDKLTAIRQTMNASERAATLVPFKLGTKAGSLVSAPLSSWISEHDLLAQRLGKLVERNRMSDADRKFYLSQVRSPAAKDAPFKANIDTVKSSLESMKKQSPISSKSVTQPSPKKEGGVLSVDKDGNKAIVYPDGTYEEVQ
jgi:hypothetical protein